MKFETGTVEVEIEDCSGDDDEIHSSGSSYDDDDGCTGESSTDPKEPSSQFLTVPTVHHRKLMRRSSSCSNIPTLTQVEQDELAKITNATPQSDLQLGSILELLPSTDGEHGDEPTSSMVDVLGFQDSYMYGRYTDLADFALQEGQKHLEKKKQQETDEDLLSKELNPYKGKGSKIITTVVRPIWNYTFAKIGEEWVFLFILGVVMASLSFIIDYGVSLCYSGIMKAYDALIVVHWAAAFVAWIGLPTLLVIFAVLFTAWVAPSAAGSGIPEMKTILRGVVLKEYLTFKTLVAKIVGLTAVIGAGLPLGKEGPVMHMASIVATMLSKLLGVIKGTVENEQRSTDLLAAACTMGVAVCYAAPIGGVLFSIEVTTTYFAVRNYWRGFFAAVVGALFYLLMKVWFTGQETIYPLFQVKQSIYYPYDVVELFPFICVSIVCGFIGAGFVFCHRRYVMFMRHNKFIKTFLMTNRLMYPIIVAIFITSLTYPAALGQFMGSQLTSTQQILQLFDNITWGNYDGSPRTLEQMEILKHWTKDGQPNFHISLLIFEVVTLVQICVASTLPVATGLLVPLMKVGAAFGRMVGEIMFLNYPNGIVAGIIINPGAYAMVGAASFCASITHTISISVIVFELTGQITYVIPIMIGVLFSNCIASLLQPSIYDSVIRIKKLPYLPDIVATTSSDVYTTFVEDIMVRNISYIWYTMKYTELKKILKENRRIKFFPLVDSHNNMILLGSVKRIELVRLLFLQISPDKRRKEAQRRQIEALKRKWMEEDSASDSRGFPRIRYEDEVSTGNTTDGGNGLLQRVSRSVTKSLARSRSASRLGSSNPPSPPMDVRDIFNQPPPSRDALERRSSRFAVSKVNGTKTQSTEGQSSESSGPSKTEESSFKSPFRKFQNKLKEKKNNAKPVEEAKASEKDEERKMFSAAKKSSSFRRSSSLDSLHRLPKVSDATSIGGESVAGDVGSDTPDGGRVSPTSGADSGTVTPKKGILKRRNSFSLGMYDTPPSAPAVEAHYQTISVGDARLRTLFLEKMKKMKIDTATSMELKLSQISLFKPKKKDYPIKRHVVDLVDEERDEWERAQLDMEVNFDEHEMTIDPAPFQLVERTSLLRVHSLFSLLGINHAYVTNIGRLRGVVALKELRLAIEGTTQKKPPGDKTAVEGTTNNTAPPTPIETPNSATNNNLNKSGESEGGHVAISIPDVPIPDHQITLNKNNLRHYDNGRMT